MNITAFAWPEAANNNPTRRGGFSGLDRVIWVFNHLFFEMMTHSIVCTTLFYGYGFGAFAHVNRTGLAGIVLVIWIVQLVISSIWLDRFRFGPAEWRWRSPTYW
jgi:uncharacterized membrane protein YeiB